MLGLHGHPNVTCEHREEKLAKALSIVVFSDTALQLKLVIFSY